MCGAWTLSEQWQWQQRRRDVRLSSRKYATLARRFHCPKVRGTCFGEIRSNHCTTNFLRSTFVVVMMVVVGAQLNSIIACGVSIGKPFNWSGALTFLTVASGPAFKTSSFSIGQASVVAMSVVSGPTHVGTRFLVVVLIAHYSVRVVQRGVVDTAHFLGPFVAHLQPIWAWFERTRYQTWKDGIWNKIDQSVQVKCARELARVQLFV